MPSALLLGHQRTKLIEGTDDVPAAGMPGVLELVLADADAAAAAGFGRSMRRGRQPLLLELYVSHHLDAGVYRQILVLLRHDHYAMTILFGRRTAIPRRDAAFAVTSPIISFHFDARIEVHIRDVLGNHWRLAVQAGRRKTLLVHGALLLIRKAQRQGRRSWVRSSQAQRIHDHPERYSLRGPAR